MLRNQILFSKLRKKLDSLMQRSVMVIFIRIIIFLVMEEEKLIMGN